MNSRIANRNHQIRSLFLALGLTNLWLLWLPQAAWAQFHFNEQGLLLGGGTNVPVGSNNLKPMYSYNCDYFFTHYRCGKRDGFHIEAGFRGYQLSEGANGTDTSLRAFYGPGAGQPNASYYFFMLQAGVYYKIRRANYNDERETAFLVGPKVNFRFFSKVRPEGGESEIFRSNGYRRVNDVIPGLYAGMLFRLPLGNKQSWFINPGLEYYFVPTASTDFISFFSLNAKLSIGFTFWNNK